jgi:hypothetical protein
MRTALHPDGNGDEPLSCSRNPISDIQIIGAVIVASLLTLIALAFLL